MTNRGEAETYGDGVAQPAMENANADAMIKRHMVDGAGSEAND